MTLQALEKGPGSTNFTQFIEPRPPVFFSLSMDTFYLLYAMRFLKA